MLTAKRIFTWVDPSRWSSVFRLLISPRSLKKQLLFSSVLPIHELWWSEYELLQLAPICHSVTESYYCCSLLMKSSIAVTGIISRQEKRRLLLVQNRTRSSRSNSDDHQSLTARGRTFWFSISHLIFQSFVREEKKEDNLIQEKTKNAKIC